jgi:hypothetical protein
MVQCILVRGCWTDGNEMFIFTGTTEKLSLDMSEVILVKHLSKNGVRSTLPEIRVA